MFDYLIVGAGFAGSVMAERLAADAGRKVLIVDRRPHIAGNAYDHYNDDGILVHRYGPHIFHTNSKDVFDYLSRFTEWRPYQHRVRAWVDGQLVPIPINLDTINTPLRAEPDVVRGRPILRAGGRAARPDPDVRGRNRQQGRSRALREVLPELHAEAVGLRSLRARRQRHRARAGPDQPRRPLLHRHLPGDAQARDDAHVRADAGASQHQDPVERRLSGSQD